MKHCSHCQGKLLSAERIYRQHCKMLGLCENQTWLSRYVIHNKAKRDVAYRVIKALRPKRCLAISDGCGIVILLGLMIKLILSDKLTQLSAINLYMIHLVVIYLMIIGYYFWRKQKRQRKSDRMICLCQYSLENYT